MFLHICFSLTFVLHPVAITTFVEFDICSFLRFCGLGGILVKIK